MKLAAVTAKGAKAASKFDWKVANFDKEPNQTLVAQAYEASRAARRTNNATTLGRGEVRGGGKKPWKQKGTGRARHGSIRSPIWRGGGITFGPSNNRNYTKSINKSAAKSALRSALQLKADNIVVIEANPTFKAPSTKQAVEFLDKSVGDDRRRTLIVTNDKSIEFKRSFSNIPNTTVVSPAQFSIVQLVDADHVLVEKDALKQIEDRL